MSIENYADYLSEDRSIVGNDGDDDPPKKPSKEQLLRWWRTTKKIAKRYGWAAGIFLRLVLTLLLLGVLDPIGDIVGQLGALVEALQAMAAGGSIPEL